VGVDGETERAAELQPDRYYLLSDAGSFFFEPGGDNDGFDSPEVAAEWVRTQTVWPDLAQDLRDGIAAIVLGAEWNANQAAQENAEAAGFPEGWLERLRPSRSVEVAAALCLLDRRAESPASRCLLGVHVRRPGVAGGQVVAPFVVVAVQLPISRLHGMQAALTDALGAQVRGVVVGVEQGAKTVATDELPGELASHALR
jgi:hypothetical protein